MWRKPRRQLACLLVATLGLLGLLVLWPGPWAWRPATAAPLSPASPSSPALPAGPARREPLVPRPGRAPVVYVIPVRGVIELGLADFVRRSLAEAGR
ncbi:MAG TPA: hypothetical protein VIL11_02240, partial [Limnochordales bacterium]